MYSAIAVASSSYAAATGLVVVASNTKTGAGNALTAHSFVGVAAGALLLVTTGLDLSGGSCTVSSSPSLTWTKRTDTGDCSGEIHTAVFVAGGSIDVTSNWADASLASSVAYVITGQEAVLGGASVHIENADPPGFADPVSGDITTTGVNSIIFGCVNDRAGLTGTAAYLDTPTIVLTHQPGTGYCAYHFYKQATTASLHTMGMSAPSGGANEGMALYEVRKA